MGQVALMPVIVAAMVLCTLAFAFYTGLAIIMAFGVFVFILPSQSFDLAGIFAAISTVCLWMVACAGTVSGISAAWDPTVKRAMFMIGYAFISWSGLAALFGGLW
jgi:hypothetical protein